MSNPLNVFRFHPLLLFSAVFFIIVVVSLVQGRVSRRFATPIYRDENPASFRNHLVFYAILGTACLFFAVKNWSTEFDPPEYSWYTATANPEQSLETVLQAASIIHPNGGVAYGVTYWSVDWHFKWSQAKHGNECWISSVYTTLRSSIILPKLVNATSAQQEQFNIFFDALRLHQLTHYEFGKSAALEIEKKISDLPKMQDCTVLQAAANAAGEKIVNDYQTRGQAYDVSNTFLQSQHAMLE
ncbi:putative secreted Zn-dependent protease [Oxalobacteraceae bacterium GrIS 2.11]